MRPRTQVLILSVSATAVVAMAWVTASNRPVPPAAYEVVPVLFSGSVSIVAGVLVGRWRPGNSSGWLLVVMGSLTLFSLLAYSNHALGFTVGGLLAGTQYALALHLLIALPEGTVHGPLDRGLVVTVYAVTVGSKVMPNLFHDCSGPFGLGCPGNLLLVRDDPDLVVALDRLWGVVGAVVVTLVAVRLAVRWWGSGATLRRVLAAPYVAGGPVLVLVVAELLGVVDRFGASSTLLAPLVLALLPVGVLLGVLRSQARSGVVGSLVTAFEPRGEAVRDQLEPLLARALGDPTARLLTPEYSAPPEAPGRRRTAVQAGGCTLAVLEHDLDAAAEPEVLAAVLATASLALENERLGRLARSQLAQVEESRRRLVTAQVEERRRLERDLHDGAQQRLVTVRLMLAMALQHEGNRGLVSEALDLVQETTMELRDLARGVHPSVVTQQGLGAAVDALAERAAVPVEVHGEVPRVAELTEVTTYFVLSEALTNVARHARATHATVHLEIQGTTLVVTVTDNGIGGADASRGTGLAGLRDRVEAAGGRLELRTPPEGGTRLVVRLPAGVTVDLPTPAGAPR